MSKAIVTVPVPDGLTSQRFFEFDLEHWKVDTNSAGALIATYLADPDQGHVFPAGQWSRLEFSTDD